MNCLSPITLREPIRHVPCGKCVACLQNKRNEWFVRLNEELKISQSAHFVTLTYAEDPISLSKRDLQLFFKRLRKLNINSKIRYYAVGEYGGNFGRPHYHVILFNLTDIRYVQDSWHLGFTHIGEVTPASINYTVAYVVESKLIPMRNPDIVPPFSLMSQGLGKNYLGDNVKRYHKKNLADYYTMEGGGKVRLPRYYRDKIFNVTERELLNVDKANLVRDEMSPLQKVEVTNKRVQQIKKLKKKNE